MGAETPGTLRLLLVEDFALVRAGLRALLAELSGIEVVAEACDGYEAIRAVETHQPDVVLMDLGLPGLSGLEATRRILQDDRGARILVVTVHGDEDQVIQALRAGASGYLVKSASTAEMETAIRTVAGGETYLSPAIARHVTAFVRRAPDEDHKRDSLAPRQLEILRLIGQGSSSREIAQQLCLSLKTVESHRANLMERLGEHNVAGLVRAAIRLGLIDCTPG